MRFRRGMRSAEVSGVHHFHIPHRAYLRGLNLTTSNVFPVCLLPIAGCACLHRLYFAHKLTLLRHLLFDFFPVVMIV